jgi:hypothetical protein
MAVEAARPAASVARSRKVFAKVTALGMGAEAEETNDMLGGEARRDHGRSRGGSLQTVLGTPRRAPVSGWRCVRPAVHFNFSSFCRERIVFGIGLSGKLVFQLV